MIHFEEITPENWRLPLQTAPSQRAYAADRATLLARAYAYRNAGSRAFVIYQDDTPVGMGLYYDCEELQSYDFSQLFIDERFQGRGYGTEAARLMLECMRRDGRYPKAVLCYIEGNDAARHLYEKLGFTETGRDEDEIIMEKLLS